MNLFASSVAFAQQAGGAAAPQAPSLLENILPFIFIFIAMYFIMIRPQAKKAKDHSKLLENLKAGDEVITSGGFIGRVKSVSDGFVTLDLGNAHVKVIKEHIASYTKAASEKLSAKAK